MKNEKNSWWTHTQPNFWVKFEKWSSKPVVSLWNTSTDTNTDSVFIVKPSENTYDDIVRLQEKQTVRNKVLDFINLK